MRHKLSALFFVTLLLLLPMCTLAESTNREAYFESIVKNSKTPEQGLNTVFFDDFFSCQNKVFSDVKSFEAYFNKQFSPTGAVGKDSFGYWFKGTEDDIKFSSEIETNYKFNLLGALYQESISPEKTSIYWGIYTSATVGEVLAATNTEKNFVSIYGALTRPFYQSPDKKIKVLMYAEPSEKYNSKSLLVCLYEKQP